MNFSSIIANPLLPLVLDTSVIVNLSACSFGEQILRVVPNKVVVAKIAADELVVGKSESLFLESLVSNALVELTELTDDEFNTFGNLVGNLGDGESATIAIAINRQIFPIIDDRKGREHAANLQRDLEPAWSLDLFRHPHVTSHLGSPADVDAIYLALINGRMRIPNHATEEVIQLIGEERAKACVSLPKYKKRFPISDKAIPI